MTRFSSEIIYLFTYFTCNFTMCDCVWLFANSGSVAMILTEITGTSNDIIFAGVATLPKKRPITELSIMDANRDEYMTRHLVDGRIVYCDHRVSVVAGYLSEEVSGLNAFAFMHKADLRWTMVGLRQSKFSYLSVINFRILSVIK